MSRRDAWNDDMWRISMHPRSRGEDPRAAQLDAIMDGRRLPDDVEPELRDLADALATMGPPAVGFPPDRPVPAVVMAAFRDASVSTPARRTNPAGSRSMVGSTLRTRTAAVLVAVGGLSVGGLTAAYATGALPSATQHQAPQGVLAPDAKPSSSASPHGPDATGPAAFGLCTAWSHRPDHGRSTSSPAFRNLIAAAGSPDNVTTYCAGVMAAHASAEPSGLPSAANTDHPTGKPSSPPGQAGKDHGHGKPSSPPGQVGKEHPHGKPSSLPSEASTDHPTGKPASSPARLDHPVGSSGTQH